MPNCLYNKDLEDAQETLNDINKIKDYKIDKIDKIKDYKMDNIKLY